MKFCQIPRNERSTIRMVRTGNMPKSMNRLVNNNLKTEALQIMETLAVLAEGRIVLEEMMNGRVLRFLRIFVRWQKVCLCGRQSRGFRGQDFTSELHLNLRDASETHKRTLAVNGKNLRITIPSGVLQTVRLLSWQDRDGP